MAQMEEDRCFHAIYSLKRLFVRAMQEWAKSVSEFFTSINIISCLTFIRPYKMKAMSLQNFVPVPSILYTLG